NTKEFCRDCADAAHAFRRGHACLRYTGRAAELVRGMKYRGESYVCEAAGDLMARRYFSLADPESGELPAWDAVVNAPMSARKRQLRGYDQAELIASAFARRVRLPHLRGALARTADTAVMSSLGREERLRNLTGTIACKADPGGGATILLIDDVYTTGATADTCAEALLDAGAAAVDVFVFAIGADGRRADE
ncbi:MAG: hypothetical protein LBR00_05550, partial [Clostridiales Family XIII bacterium]|nr:hypothetical protein [Clostridiales Family XIII bacterium]